MALNNKLLRRIRNHILEEPRRYDQTALGEDVSKRVSPCGTVACIAGWADFLANNTHPTEASIERAQLALNLTENETHRLFSGNPSSQSCDGCRWPEPYATDYHKARTKQAKAEVAARYLNRIARTGKVD